MIAKFCRRKGNADRDSYHDITSTFAYPVSAQSYFKVGHLYQRDNRRTESAAYRDRRRQLHSIHEKGTILTVEKSNGNRGSSGSQLLCCSNSRVCGVWRAEVVTAGRKILRVSRPSHLLVLGGRRCDWWVGRVSGLRTPLQTPPKNLFFLI
jgi:hypothetical protein